MRDVAIFDLSLGSVIYGITESEAMLLRNAIVEHLSSLIFSIGDVSLFRPRVMIGELLGGNLAIINSAIVETS
jgi:hypothetical protein